MNESKLDVRELEPRDRHTAIFTTWEELGAGEAFELVNDHDPVPLFYQLQATRPGEFTWDAVEEGPEVWRIRIGKPAA